MIKPQTLLDHAKNAAQHAYAPYSHFYVGAALTLLDGTIVTGCNVENASYGLTMCAERVALFNAVHHFGAPLPAMALAVWAEKGKPTGAVTPCGACRQVMAELLPPETPVWFLNAQGTIAETTVSDLLPATFTLPN